MNPLTKVKLINELNEREADLGVNESVSWHTEYKESAWIFVGGFPYELTEGDIICVFSQYGEVVNINVVRDKKTGKSKGFCFLCYEDQRSTILAVDNFNGIKIKGRTIRVDHVKDYRPPKDSDDIDDITKNLREQGCAPKVTPQPSLSSEEDEQYTVPVKKPKKDKKEKKKKKKEKKEKKKAEKEKERASRAVRSPSSSSSSSSSAPPPAVRVKEEKQDAAYDKYNQRESLPGERQQNGQKVMKEDERRRETEREREEDRKNRDRSRERDYCGKREMDRESERKFDRDREIERRREMGRETDRRRERETDREGQEDRRKNLDWSRERETDRRRETDRESDRRDGERRREHDRDRESDRRRERETERERDRPRKH